MCQFVSWHPSADSLEGFLQLAARVGSLSLLMLVIALPFSTHDDVAGCSLLLVGCQRPLTALA